jgi:TRAP-type mannitol/chloroaromatic compound transport system substrate-binding protein
LRGSSSGSPGRGEVNSALEKGSIDAAEFVGPMTTRSFFYKVAKYYYYRLDD